MVTGCNQLEKEIISSHNNKNTKCVKNCSLRYIGDLDCFPAKCPTADLKKESTVPDRSSTMKVKTTVFAKANKVFKTLE